jgi:hypothetical protein
VQKIIEIGAILREILTGKEWGKKNPITHLPPSQHNTRRRLLENPKKVVIIC